MCTATKRLLEYLLPGWLLLPDQIALPPVDRPHNFMWVRLAGGRSADVGQRTFAGLHPQASCRGSCWCCTDARGWNRMRGPAWDRPCRHGGWIKRPSCGAAAARGLTLGAALAVMW
jgi:hypothetical protein